MALALVGDAWEHAVVPRRSASWNETALPPALAPACKRVAVRFRRTSCVTLMRSASNQAHMVGLVELMSACGGLNETCRHEPPKCCALCKQCSDGRSSTGHEFIIDPACMMQADHGMIVLREYESTRATG